MLAAAITHIVVSAGLLIETSGVSDGDPRMEVAGFSIFAAIWLALAWLFRNSSR